MGGAGDTKRHGAEAVAMQKRFPSLSFCVGIAFGKRRAEAVVCARWCGARVVWRAGGVRGVSGAQFM